ncbi:MAG: isoamylase early set domain-containing protein [Bacteroidales bacterium]|jgi:1,4-alpha-glucan branching enzyme|nr:isoamylase early set domain-containing protein [Bacteroidales bacterium]
MKKTFPKASAVCKVTFTISADLLGGAKKASVAGDFNDWDIEELPFKITNGTGSVSRGLPLGREFQYKFVIDGTRWENDPETEGYAPNGLGDYNSVVKTYK